MSEQEHHEALTEAFGRVFANSGVEGLDDDLIDYMSGLLAHSDPVETSDEYRDVLDEVLVPFLDSVSCPDDLQTQAVNAALQVWKQQQDEVSAKENMSATRKLTQGVVNMSLEANAGGATDDTSRYLWGTTQIKAMHNDLVDAYDNNQSSAKDKRKVRKEAAVKARQALSSRNDENVDSGGGNSLVRMKYNVNAAAGTNDKSRDVLVRNFSVSLNNGTVLLEPTDFKLAHPRRYGLIGENGVGKSTLLKALASDDLPGFPSHLRVLHVRQEVPAHFNTDLTVTQTVMHADAERNMLIEKEKALLKQLEQPDSNVEGESIADKRQRLMAGNSAMQAQLKELDQVYSRLQIIGSDHAPSRATSILSGLQFTPEMQQATLQSLSGGWKMRVALAAALFVQPDVLLLDEPTNHLDLEAVLWLEQYLEGYPYTLVVVSHDRGFLNSVCTDIIEFKRKKLTYYRGNFDTYVKLRDENIKNAMRQYQAYQAKREHMMEFINTFRANAKRASMVQSRIKAVEKMDAEAPEPIEVDSVWRFNIPNSEPLGPPIIAINDVYFDYKPELEDGTKKSENDYLLQEVNFGVSLTSKIAILGANGQGKTTLLNLIMGKLRPLKGSVSIHANLRIGHFTQHSSDNFDLKLSALENLLNMFDEAEDQEMRSFLGKFQIQGNDALKPMMLLSGGQKSRVAFAALAYRKPHVLVVDEGSNHLSMEAVDALVEAMQDFKGGILVVSHDQYFVSKTCTELWAVDRGRATRFRGDFDDYKNYTSKMTQKRVDESLKKLGAMSN